MPAGPYCPYVEQKGVVTIPQGHYLFSFLGTEYQAVLEEYLGLGAESGGTTCTLHGGGPSGSSSLPNRQAEDAARLIAAAQQQLATLDPAGGQYAAIVNAATNLQSLINSGASQNEITSAMTALTQAMIGIF